MSAMFLWRHNRYDNTADLLESNHITKLNRVSGNTILAPNVTFQDHIRPILVNL